MAWWQIALIVLASIAVLLFLICYFSYVYTFKRRKKDISPYHQLDGEDKNGKKAYSRKIIDEFLKIKPTKEVYIDSHDGIKLYGVIYEVDKNAPFEIAFHGYRSLAVRDMSGGGKEVLDRGHNLLLVHQRAHGKSEGKTISFGINERFDVKSWAEYIAREYPKSKILLVGISMGASSVIMAGELSLPENVVGILADSPYSSPAEIIKKVSKDIGCFLTMLYPFVKLGAKIFGGFNLEEASPKTAVKNYKYPLLIIHGEGDSFVPCSMSREIKTMREDILLETFEGANHGLSYICDTERYRKITCDFIEKILGEKVYEDKG